MGIDWSDFNKPLVWLSTVGGFIIGGAFVAAFMYYTITYRIPAMETREDKQDQEIKQEFTTLNGSINQQFASIRGDVREQLAPIKLRVSNLSTNVLLLCGQRRPISKTCDVKALVEQVKAASQIQAEYFAAADMKLTEGSTPIVADEDLKRQLPDYIPVSYTHSGAQLNSQKRSEFASQIIWSSAADSARWHQEGNSIVVVFANGRASFNLSAPNTKEHVGALVQSLNANTEVLKAAGSIAPDKK